ncbi:hypothetical protein G3I01_01880 [Gramella sp. MT6]|uniref:Uncharacterized protein n=1 Tax=Christiangramia gaetbulicola TaxID=703340 RepID=A0A2T6AKQ8_9FLAO|nr:MULTISPECIES: hypothetical protein [Christiangramia]PTX44390.1 hypothetical protein C8P64_0369 [Christiangramia gaetbulicola]QYA24306.1 hypothetical protein G3I01_01880 [Gramella sp. MT6]
MILIVNKWLLSGRFKGISLWPFVILQNRHLKQDVFFINHEKIHLRQQLEMLILFFYVWYAIEFFVRYLDCKDGMLAYRNISFEREAYRRENDLNYLKNRSFWAFRNFL